ncbi:MAG: tyrosine/phenylalanine carboxypeptidase domain-containing protein, partial [Patescibacteria group bacterium]
AQDLFGERVRKRERGAPDRPVLGTRETVSIAGDGVNVEVLCAIDPSHERTVFSPELIRELRRAGGAEVQDLEEKRYLVKLVLKGKKIQTVIEEGSSPYDDARAVIGRRDLMGFLIDPGKQRGETRTVVTVKEDLRAIDRAIAQVDRVLLVLKFVRPKNLLTERQKLERDRTYNPVFEYGELPEGLRESERRLASIMLDDSPLGVLFEKKRRELLTRISLLRARGNAMRFMEASFALYGSPSAALLSHAHSSLASRLACDLPAAEGKSLAAEEAAQVFSEALARYGMHEWQVQVRPRVVSDCAIGRKRVYLRQGARFSEARLHALIAHEIETHALTQENGERQPFRLLQTGCANYLDTQEGLAIFSQNRVLSLYHEKRYDAASNVLAVAFALTHSFADTRAYLEEILGYAPDRALTKTIQYKRGMNDTHEPGCFTKDLVYFRGFRAIEHFAQGGGDLKRLYVGKIAIEDLELVEKIPGILPPLILPEHLTKT